MRRAALATGLLAMACAALWPCAGWAKPPPTVRITTGDHPGFGRVVLDAPGLTYTVNRDGGHVLIRLSGDPILAQAPRAPRNVLAIQPIPGGIDIDVAPEANVRTSRMGDKIVVDIDNVPAGRAAAASHEAAKQEQAAPLASRPPAKPAAPEKPAKPAAARSPNELPVKEDLVVSARHEMARSDSAITAMPGLASSARNASATAPEPRAAEPEDAKSAPPVAAPVMAAPPITTPQGTAPLMPAPPIAAPVAPPPTGEPPARELLAAAPATSPLAVPPLAAEAHTAPPLAAAAVAAPELTIVRQQGQVEPSAHPPAGQPAVPRADATEAWPVIQDGAPSGPVALLAVMARPPGGLEGVAVRIPFAKSVGAALFSRGSDTFVVFDERRPIDLSAIRDDPAFASAVVTIFPTATLIRLTRTAGQSAMLIPAQLGWLVSIVAATPKPGALRAEPDDNAMTVTANAPGQVVAISDPRTGGTLLIGTQRTSGQGILIERRTPEFILPVTGQGILVEPLSDSISLRLSPTGFILSGAPTGLVLSAPQPMAEVRMAAAGLTRLFVFPAQTTENLETRAKAQAVAAAMAPLLTRGPRRHALAESMLGLGLGAEAQTVLRLTMKDDPREAASPNTIGLAAIAALLAGRPREAGDLADPRLSGTDEIAMWRAIQMAMADEGSPAAAAVLATTAPLLFTYPAELRRRLLPLVLETMVQGGQPEAAARLLEQREKDPKLAYARALLKQVQGDRDGALASFDEVTETRSTLDHARAAVRATELRLAMGQLDAKGAAGALETRLDAWRGDRRDLALRLRIAELRAKEGAWRTVFALLRGVRADFPGQETEVDRRLKEAFAAVPRDPLLDKMEPTELIALLDENAGLMADGPDGEPMRELLAKKLMALDLPKRADPLLTKLMRAAPFGPARAGFGATLATMRLREGDGDGAILALSESNSADMPEAVHDRRALITARVQAIRGDLQGAVEALSGTQAPEAQDTRAAVLEQAQDWPAARDALTLVAARVVPAGGKLDDAQLGVVLRLATAATRANDDATLAGLREKLKSRIGTGPQADMFRLLTAEPVRGTRDLGRARTEMGLARALTADLGAKKPPVKVP